MKQIIGQIANISFDSKHIWRGGFLVIDENGNEWIIRRNFSGSFRKSWKCYRSSKKLQAYIKTETVSTRRGYLFVMIVGGSIGAKILETIFPSDWFFGKINDTFSPIQGLLNISCTLLSILLVLCFVSYARQKQLTRFLSKIGAKLVYVDRITPKEVLQHNHLGREIW